MFGLDIDFLLASLSVWETLRVFCALSPPPQVQKHSCEIFAVPLFLTELPLVPQSSISPPVKTGGVDLQAELRLSAPEE